MSRVLHRSPAACPQELPEAASTCAGDVPGLWFALGMTASVTCQPRKASTIYSLQARQTFRISVCWCLLDGLVYRTQVRQANGHLALGRLAEIDRYCQASPRTVACSWRGSPAGSPELCSLRGLSIDLQSYISVTMEQLTRHVSGMSPGTIGCHPCLA